MNVDVDVDARNGEARRTFWSKARVLKISIVVTSLYFSCVKHSIALHAYERMHGGEAGGSGRVCILSRVSNIYRIPSYFFFQLKGSSYELTGTHTHTIIHYSLFYFIWEER